MRELPFDAAFHPGAGARATVTEFGNQHHVCRTSGHRVRTGTTSRCIPRTASCTSDHRRDHHMALECNTQRLDRQVLHMGRRFSSAASQLYRFGGNAGTTKALTGIFGTFPTYARNAMWTTGRRLANTGHLTSHCERYAMLKRRRKIYRTDGAVMPASNPRRKQEKETEQEALHIPMLIFKMWEERKASIKCLKNHTCQAVDVAILKRRRKTFLSSTNPKFIFTRGSKACVRVRYDTDLAGHC